MQRSVGHCRVGALYGGDPRGRGAPRAPGPDRARAVLVQLARAALSAKVLKSRYATFRTLFCCIFVCGGTKSGVVWLGTTISRRLSVLFVNLRFSTRI